jgi:hypothetical protein
LFAGSINVLDNALIQVIAESKLNPNWSTTNDKFGYAPQVRSTFASCAFMSGTVSAQIAVTKSYVDDGNMKVGLYYEDSNHRRAYFAPVLASTLKANGWTTINASLTSYNAITNVPFVNVDALFNSNSITNVGVYFDANGKSPSVKGEISVDNIVIKPN